MHTFNLPHRGRPHGGDPLAKGGIREGVGHEQSHEKARGKITKELLHLDFASLMVPIIRKIVVLTNKTVVSSTIL